MARNFRIKSRKTEGPCTALQLAGDFDGSSAYELINMLDDIGRKDSRVAIDTDGLNKIYHFGINVFNLQMAKQIDRRANIQVTGRFSHAFSKQAMTP